jgi:YHS domain-containing protein
MNITDPVCGRSLGLEDAVACEEHDGWAYFFCSSGCRDAFICAPKRYASRPNPMRGSFTAEASNA